MRRLAVVVWLLLVGGCSILPPKPANVPRPENFQSASFALNGRVSVKHRDSRHSAIFRWTHQAQSDEILLLNPLGQTVARVYRDDGMATLDDGTKHYADVDAESLMQQVLGWHMPFDGLHYWVMGVPEPGAASHIEYAGNGQISLLRQDGWDVRYLRYADGKPGSLPVHLELGHDDLQMQLLVDEWDWNPK
jgi:outer membrane lipoprotein LolB